MRDKTTLSLLMIDIDKFKDYNDAYGYPQGDVLLHVLAQTMTRSLRRPADFIARVGGEEFGVIMPNTDAHGARTIAEIIRADVQAKQIAPLDETTPTSITVSIGANSIIPSPEYSMAEFIVKTDSALFSAKKSGRNRVCS
jgi:diguanylate cyclase (GGDEF)-like protein